NTWVGELKIWHTQTAEVLLGDDAMPFGPDGTVAFSPDGKQFAFGADDRAIHVRDTETGKERAALRGESARPGLVAYRADGKLLASGGFDGIVQLWDPESYKPVRTFRGDTGILLELVFSADGRRLMTVSTDNRLVVWDALTGQDPLILPMKGLTM